MSMSESPLPQDVGIIPIDHLTYMVPSRTFRIEGTLLKGGYVSLATEFALRLLRASGELPVGEVGAFFGFSELETKTLIQELLLDGYLHIFGERVGLSQRGTDSFNPITGELQMLEIEPFGVTMSFDLLAFAPIDSVGGGRMPWLPELEIVNKERASASSHGAREGFRANFGEWRDRRFSGDGRERVRLHTIEDVTPLARSLTPVSVPIIYAPSATNLIEPDFSSLLSRGRRGAREELVVALNESIRRVSAPTDYEIASELASIWDSGVIRAQGPLRVHDPITWIQMAHCGSPALPDCLVPSLRLGGSLMTQGSIASLTSFLDGLDESPGTGAPVFWAPAEHAAWGASANLTEVVRVLKGRSKPEHDIVYMPRSGGDSYSARDIVRTYGPGKDGRTVGFFDACISLAGSPLPLSLELLVRPRSWAIVLVHVPSPQSGYPTPIGYITSNSAVVDRISHLFADLVCQMPSEHVLWSSSSEEKSVVLAAMERLLRV